MSGDVYECPKCREVIHPDASVCPHCGHRRTSLLKLILGGALAIVILAAGFSAIVDSNTPKAALTPQQSQDDNYDLATFACQSWTEKNAALALDEVTDRYTLPRKKADAPNLYRVEIVWRAKGQGLRMYTVCGVLHDEKLKVFLVPSARSAPYAR
jgi:hypothetical protein